MFEHKKSKRIAQQFAVKTIQSHSVLKVLKEQKDFCRKILNTFFAYNSEK